MAPIKVATPREELPCASTVAAITHANLDIPKEPTVHGSSLMMLCAGDFRTQHYTARIPPLGAGRAAYVEMGKKTSCWSYDSPR